MRGFTDNAGTPAPTLHQPLSHGAKRRDSSPFRGAEGWEEVCGVSASAYRDADTYCHDADTYVSLMPVRGGVLDAPWSCDHRADLYAPVRRAQFYPCLPRRARLASTAQRIISRGHSPRTIFYVRTHVFHHPTPGGRGSPPLRGICISPTLHQPLSHAATRRDSSPFRGAEGAARRRRPSTHAGRAKGPVRRPVLFLKRARGRFISLSPSL